MTQWIQLSGKIEDVFPIESEETDAEIKEQVDKTAKWLQLALQPADMEWTSTGAYVYYRLCLETKERADAVLELLGMFTIFDGKLD